MNLIDVTSKKVRAAVSRLTQFGERHFIAAPLIFSSSLYSFRYFQNEATPGNSPFLHPLGWWGWFDQGKYLQSINAFYSIDLDPNKHFYPPLYPLVGTLGRMFSSGHPFFFINLFSYWIYTLCFLRIASIYLSKIQSIVLWVLVSTVSLETVDLFVIPWTTSLQSCLIMISLLLIYRETNSGAQFRTRGILKSVVIGFIVGLLVSNRPGDFPISLIILVFGIWLWSRSSFEGGRNVALLRTGLLVGGWGLSLAMFLGFNRIVYGSPLGSYVATAESNGYFPKEILKKSVSLLLESHSLYLEEGLGVFEVMPWMTVVIAGSTCFLIVGNGVLRSSILICFVYVALFLPYGDLLPNGMWRYLNFHYFAWTVPYLSLGLVAFARQCFLGGKLNHKLTLVGGIFVICVFNLLGFSTKYSSLETFVWESGTVKIQFDHPKQIDFIDFADIESNFETAYFGQHEVRVNGDFQRNIREYRMIEFEGTVRLLFQQRIEVKNIEIKLDERMLVEGTRYRTGVADVSLDLKEEATPNIPIMTGLRFGIGVNERGVAFLGQGWSSPEAWGTWSDAKSSYLRIPMEKRDSGTWQMRMVYNIFLPDGHCQTIEVRAKLETLLKRVYCEQEDQEVRTELLRFNTGHLSQKSELVLQFLLPDAVSPKKFYSSNDERKLSIGLREFTIENESLWE